MLTVVVVSIVSLRLYLKQILISSVVDITKIYMMTLYESPYEYLPTLSCKSYFFRRCLHALIPHQLVCRKYSLSLRDGTVLLHGIQCCFNALHRSLKDTSVSMSQCTLVSNSCAAACHGPLEWSRPAAVYHIIHIIADIQVSAVLSN